MNLSQKQGVDVSICSLIIATLQDVGTVGRSAGHICRMRCIRGAACALHEWYCRLPAKRNYTDF
jgi:hypothetical protein